MRETDLRHLHMLRATLVFQMGPIGVYQLLH